MNVDKLDKKILNMLLEDGTLTYKQIAKKLESTPATIHNRLKRMKREKILLGVKPVLDTKKLGYDVDVLINVSVTKGINKELEDFIRKQKNVIAAYSVSGEYDKTLIAKFKSMEEADLFIDKINRINNVVRTVSNFVFHSITEEFSPKTIY